MKYIKPERLRKGDTIGIIAPSAPISIPMSQYKRLAAFLETKGYNVKESRHLFANKDYMAGTVKQRLNDLHSMFRDNSVKAIMCFWGGLVANQLIEKIDYKLIASSPKIFIGYSDITTLQSAITSKTGLITYSGPGGITFTKPSFYDYSWEYFSKVCVETDEDIRIEPSPFFSDDQYWLKRDSNKRKRKKNSGPQVFIRGKAKGRIVVGNLQSLLDVHGTPFAPDYNKSLLFIEEDEEVAAAMIERLLFKYRLLGVYKKIGGLVLGRFAESNGFSNFEKIESMLTRALEGYKFPVLYNIDFGHTDPIITIPFGGLGSIDTSSKKITLKRSVK